MVIVPFSHLTASSTALVIFSMSCLNDNDIVKLPIVALTFSPTFNCFSNVALATPFSSNLSALELRLSEKATGISNEVMLS